MWSAGNNPHHTGFTLLELLVVLTLASLLLAVVTPRFAALLPGAELKSYSQQTAALLRLARSQAISRGEEVALIFDSELRETRLTQPRLGFTWPDGLNLVLKPRAQGQLEQLEPSPRITFYPDGRTEGGEVRITSATRQYRIQIDWLTGRIQFEQ